MNEVSYIPAATFPIAILLIPQVSNLKCRKDLRKALRLVHQCRKQKHVASSRDTAHQWDNILRVTLKALRVRDTLKCGPGITEVQAPDVVLFSMSRETEGAAQTSLEVSQKRKPRETESTCESRSEHERPSWTRCKRLGRHRWTLRRCTFRYGRDLWFHRCRRHCSWTRVTKQPFGNTQESLDLRTSKACSRLQE